MRRTHVSDLYELAGGETVFAPVLFETEADAVERDIELSNYYSGVRHHLDGARFDAPPDAVRHIVSYEQPHEVTLPEYVWHAPRVLQDFYPEGAWSRIPENTQAPPSA